MSQLDQPLNANERYLHGINLRLDALINMLSNFVDVYAKQNNLAVTKNVVEEKIETPRRSKKK